VDEVDAGIRQGFINLVTPGLKEKGYSDEDIAWAIDQVSDSETAKPKSVTTGKSGIQRLEEEINTFEELGGVEKLVDRLDELLKARGK
jgi:hypothetical protein